MTLADKLDHLAAMARRNPDDKYAIRWRLEYLVSELYDNPPGRAIDDMLGRPKDIPVNLEKAA